MADLILSPAQVQIVVTTSSPLRVRDEGGKLLGYLSPVVSDPDFTAEDIAATKAALRQPGPRRMLAEIIANLKSMDAA